jgi:hypothetical protein
MKKKRHAPLVTDSYLEEMFWDAWHVHKSTPGIRIDKQRKFHPEREWRFDFVLPDSFTAIEIQGYGSGHASYMGLKNDYMKNNEALRHGWVVLFFMKHDLFHGVIKKTISYVLEIHHQRLHIPKLYPHIQLNVAPKPKTDSFQDILNRYRKKK